MVKVGIGFLGAGDVAYLHQLAFRKIPTAKIVAVFDVDAQKSRKLAGDLGAKVCESADTLVNLPEVQAVYVLTPEPAHHENVMRSLHAGKHTFVEKPVSFSREPIREWIEIAVISDIGAAEQRGIFLKSQGDVALELDRAGKIATCRKRNRPATSSGAVINYFLDTDGVQRRAVADHTGGCYINDFVRGIR